MRRLTGILITSRSMLKLIRKLFKTSLRLGLFTLQFTLTLGSFCGEGRADHQASHKTCDAGGMSRLTKMIAERHPTKLIFFASWCPSCREHLLESNPGKDILIATFDEKEQAEKALTALKISAPCLLDDGISKELKVIDVPFSLDVIDGKIQPSKSKK